MTWLEDHKARNQGEQQQRIEAMVLNHEERITKLEMRINELSFPPCPHCGKRMATAMIPISNTEPESFLVKNNKESETK